MREVIIIKGMDYSIHISPLNIITDMLIILDITSHQCARLAISLSYIEELPPRYANQLKLTPHHSLRQANSPATTARKGEGVHDIRQSSQWRVARSTGNTILRISNFKDRNARGVWNVLPC